MKTDRGFISRVGIFVLRSLLSIRYKVELKKGDLRNLDLDKGTLFLANHSSRLDPLVLFSSIPAPFLARPVVVEYVYRIKFLQPILKWLRAIPIPNFDTAVNGFKVKKAEQILKMISEDLGKGDAFIFYPSARMKKNGVESIGGSSGTHFLLQSHPDINIVLIRMTGFWGSRFSWGYEGRSPDLALHLKESIKAVIKNGFFFLPRRKILIEMEMASKDFPRNGKRLEVNRALEEWYNRYPDESGKVHATEPLRLIPYSIWRPSRSNDPKKNILIPPKKSSPSLLISDKISEKICAEIRRILFQPNLKISPEMALSTDLGMDSLDIAELLTYISRETRAMKFAPELVGTVRDVFELASGHSNIPPPKPISFHWPEEKIRPELEIPLGNTIPEAFLSACKRMGSSVVIADPILGVLTYQKLKKATLVLAEHFRTLPDTHVAILLPAAVTTYLLILALQIAGKTPVMLNWTTGPRYLEHMIEITKIETILSSWNFLDRVPNIELGSAGQRIRFIEDIKEQISLKAKLRGVFFKPKIRVNEHDTAVILFTSGTESLPKGVPLTHHNLLSNLRALFHGLPLYNSDVVFSALPPFHCFGFTVTGIFPILLGVRLSLSSDPTDHFALASGIQHWGATIFATSSSFLRNLLCVSDKNQLDTIRIFCTGAEKTGEDVFQKAERLQPNAKVIEGYGITECSCAIACGHDGVRKGIGKILKGIDALVLRPETNEILSPGEEGEIIISGPTVFKGYLCHSQSPFVEILGKRWYRTGDLGIIDKDKILYITGRLKRFLKIAGEMISLGAIEETISKELEILNQSSLDLPLVVVSSKEVEMGKQQVILFSKIPIKSERANEILRQAGFSPLIKIASSFYVETFPLMGNGKIDYRKLDELISQ